MRFIDFCKKELENFFLYRKNKLQSLIILIQTSGLTPFIYSIIMLKMKNYIFFKNILNDKFLY